MHVESRVEIYEVREETACRHFACQSVQIVIGVFGKVVHAFLLLPYLDRENGGGAVAYPLICGVEKFAYHAAPLCRGVGAVIYGTEHNLVAATRVDGVHVVYEGFHRLVHTAYSGVYRML